MDTIQRTHELDKISTSFDQFIIAVNGALIAYAFKQVENRELAYKLIPLGIAIMCWGFSFYFGVSSIRKIISTRIIDIFRSSSDIIRNNPSHTETARKGFSETGARANKLNKGMYVFLYFGGAFYIVWQILEMYLRIGQPITLK